MRPNFVTEEDLNRWDEKISEEADLLDGFADIPEQKEVCRAGIWLYEQLVQLNASEKDILSLQYFAGQLSVDNDTWEVHQKTLELYKKSFNDFS